MKRSTYGPKATRPAAANPIVLSIRGAFWLYWLPVVLVVALLIAAMGWLLTRPLPT
jgi:hypothetical protein